MIQFDAESGSWIAHEMYRIGYVSNVQSLLRYVLWGKCLRHGLWSNFAYEPCFNYKILFTHLGWWVQLNKQLLLWKWLMSKPQPDNWLGFYGRTFNNSYAYIIYSPKNINFMSWHQWLTFRTSTENCMWVISYWIVNLCSEKHWPSIMRINLGFSENWKT